ncbi:MAG: hypothetical protein ABI833_06585 [Acidobacteriota bacterium]
MRSTHALVIVGLAFLAACEQTPAPPRDATKEAWYRETREQLTALNRAADSFFAGGNADQAAALIEKGQPLVARLLNVPNPTVEAAVAASDLDDLYGRMLLANRHYGWARLLFQKNLSRWKHWQPQTPETARRLQQAESAIAECDRHIEE